jgi:hypothetical protein
LGGSSLRVRPCISRSRPRTPRILFRTTHEKLPPLENVRRFAWHLRAHVRWQALGYKFGDRSSKWMTVAIARGRRTAMCCGSFMGRFERSA